MDFPIHNIQYQIVEYQMSEVVKLKCGDLHQEVTLPQAQKFADALKVFLRVPENTKKFDDFMMRRLRVPEDQALEFDTKREKVSLRLWHLECSARRGFYWEERSMMRTHHLFFTAKLQHLKDEDRWVVPAIDIGRLIPKR